MRQLTTGIDFLLLLACTFLAGTSQGATIEASLDKKYGLSPGGLLQVQLNLKSAEPLGGVDFTFQYDWQNFSFIEAVKDTGLPNWESFYVSSDASSHTVSVSSIADVVNGPIHPRTEDFYPNGPIATFTFLVSENWTQDSSALPLHFLWTDCGANAASNRVGDTLIILDRVYDYLGRLVWSEQDSVNYPDEIRPDSVGVPDSCLVGTNSIAFWIDFHDGVLANFVNCGDADLNGFTNVADAVYLMNYIFGGGPPPNPLAAGDVDCQSGINISDVVYLIGYIFGSGAAPCADCP